MFIKEIMTKEVITISEDDCLEKAGKLFKDKRISGIPVINKTGNVIGIITVTDMLTFILDNIYQWVVIEKCVSDSIMMEMLKRAKATTKVSDVMTRKVVTLNEQSKIFELMKCIYEEKVHTIPVLKNGQIIGIVGRRDLVSLCF